MGHGPQPARATQRDQTKNPLPREGVWRVTMEKQHVPQRVAKNSNQTKKIALLAAGGAVAVLLAGYLGLCAWVGNSPAILDGVSVAGVPVGGLTREQALETLESRLEQVSGQVVLPLEYGSWEGEITAGAVEIDQSVIAQTAWETGREHFLLQGGAYLAHRLGAEAGVDLALNWTESGQKELEEKMDEADLQVGGALTNASYAVEGDKLMLTKGVTGVTIDREAAEPMVMDAMTAAVSDALQGGSNPVEPVALPAHETTPQEPDFDAMYAELHAEAKSAEIDPETLEVSDHVVGIDFDVDQAKAMFDVAAEGETVEIPLTITEPEETREGLEAKLFRDLLGEGTSRVSGSANRKSNVKLSASACNGVVLMPGEIFSYNNTTGSRTAEKGYLGAPVYSGGASVEGIGGGICQTSSTIYYAVLHTTLEIVERHAHMYAVGYVPDGMDATVWYGASDFRFKNNTNYPVKVVTESYDKNGSRYLTVKIYGTNEDGRYAVPERIQYDYIQPTVQYKADASVPQGTTRVDSVQNAYVGLKAQTYRYIYEADGTLVERQDMGVSSYKMRPTTILYNPADGDPSQPASTQEPEIPADTAPETPVTTPENPDATTPETPAVSDPDTAEEAEGTAEGEGGNSAETPESVPEAGSSSAGGSSSSAGQDVQA